jgi:hypothetical protein
LWDVDVSADSESWQEVDHKEHDQDVNGKRLTGMLAVADERVRFFWLTVISRNQSDDDTLCFSA